MRAIQGTIVVIVLALFIAACSPKPAPECVYKECTCEDTLAVTENSGFFPFDRNLEVVAYEFNSSMSDRCMHPDSGNVINPAFIKASHVMNPEEILQLEKICLNRTQHCNDYTCEEGNNCLYDPGHCIVFYDGDEIVAYLELSFQCNDVREWPSGLFGTKCGDFLQDMRWLLHKMSFDVAALHFDFTNGYEADTSEIWKGHFTTAQ